MIWHPSIQQQVNRISDYLVQRLERVALSRKIVCVLIHLGRRCLCGLYEVSNHQRSANSSVMDLTYACAVIPKLKCIKKASLKYNDAFFNCPKFVPFSGQYIEIIEFYGAQKKTRTSTSFRILVPETSASTNSAIWALL